MEKLKQWACRRPRTALVLASRGIDPHDLSLEPTALEEVASMLESSRETGAVASGLSDR